MKRKFLIIVTALYLGSGLSAFADTETFDVRAQVVATIVITETFPAVGLNFGNLETPAAGSTTFTIAAVGGTQLSAGQAAEFTVVGEAGLNFLATVAPASILLTGPGVDVLVNNFTVSPSAPTLLPFAGSIFVGGDAIIPSTQVAGAYTNIGGMTLTVLYQ